MKYFRKNDFIFTLLITIAEIALIFLYFSIAFLTDTSRRQIGEIVFKERIATRRQTDVFHWQTLHTKSPIYEYDTIRTADKAEAEILFNDGTKLDILENTLVKLQGIDDEDFADIESGSVSVETANTSKKISFAGNVVDLVDKAKLSLSYTEDETKIKVEEGSASVSANGENLVIQTSQKINFSSGEEKPKVEKVKIQKIPTRKNQKFVTYKKDAPVTFSFMAENPGDAKVVIAQDKNFKKVYKTVTQFSKDEGSSNTYSCKEKIPLEKVYWKVVYEDGEESEIQSVEIQQVEKISKFTTEANARVISTGDDSKVKFSWANMDNATSYVFEVSESADFSNTIIKQTTRNSSIQIASLDDGSYYWRVTPNYSGKLLDKPESITRQLQVEKNDSILPLKINYPVNGYKFNIQEKKDFSFSWERRKNAEEYTLSLYRDENSEAAEKFVCTENTARFSLLDSKLFQDEGKVFWTVSYKNKNGKLSPLSQKLKIEKIRNDFQFKSVFPKDNYAIAASLIQNIRFTWKNDSGLRTNFIVSSDEKMRNVVYKKNVDTTSVLGLFLEEGKYFWCVEMLDFDGSVLKKSEIKTFNVVKNLPAVDFVSPMEHTLVPLFNDPHVLVEWEEIPNADYYEVEIYEPSGSRIVFNPYAKCESIDISAGKYNEGTYRISVQPFALDTIDHTKNVGLKKVISFESKKLTVASLVSPKINTSVDGISAYNNGVNFSWKSHQDFEKQELVLVKNGKIIKKVSAGQKGNVSVLVPKLESGTYTWYVSGKFRNYDVSSHERYSLTVLPVPPLEVPRFNADAMKKLINIPYLKENRNIPFAWSSSQYASYYILTISDARKKTIFSKKIYDTNYDFTSLRMLSNGSFQATINAVSDKQLKGLSTESMVDTFSFVVDLPEIEKPKNILTKDREYYGY